MPARYILRFTFCVKFSSGLFGKILPPPRHSGLDVMPGARAAGALLAPGLLGRVGALRCASFCARVPRRALAVVGGDDLVHQRLVVFAPEQRRPRRPRVACACALVVDQLEFHYLAPFAPWRALAFTLGARSRRRPWSPAPSP